MNNREVMQQALEAIRIFREWETGQDYESCRATVLARALAAEESLGAALAEPEQDAELAAALGWPGGISTPVLDRHVLLDIVAKQRSAALVVAQEREACAKTCEARSLRDDDMGAILARAIRARSRDGN